MMYNKFFIRIGLLFSLLLAFSFEHAATAKEAFDPVSRFWYSLDGNHWVDGQLMSVVAESDGGWSIVLKRPDGSSTRQIRLDKLSPADQAYVSSAIQLRAALGRLTKSEFVGAAAELDKVRTGLRDQLPYYRGVSQDFFSIELGTIARPRARFGELRSHDQDFAPNLVYAEFDNRHAQFPIRDLRFSDAHAGVERISVLDRQGGIADVGSANVTQIRLLPDWLAPPHYRLPVDSTTSSAFVSMRAPKEYPVNEGYVLKLDPTRKIWTTELELEAYDKLDTSTRLWFDALELEKPYVVRRLVRTGDQYCNARDFRNAIRAYEEAIRIGKARADINLRLAYAEFGQGVDSQGTVRRAHYARAQTINDEVSTATSPGSKIYLASRYLGAWILAGNAGEQSDDTIAHSSFQEALKIARQEAEPLSNALSLPDDGSEISPAIRIFLLAKTSGLQELTKFAYDNMAMRCNRRLVGDVDLWIVLRKRASLSAYQKLVEELEKVRSLSFGQEFIDVPAWEMSIRCNTEASQFAPNARASHQMHQDAMDWANRFTALLAPANYNSYLKSPRMERLNREVADFLNQERGSDSLEIFVQKHGRTDMCNRLTRAQQAASQLQGRINEELDSPSLESIPHEKWSRSAFEAQEGVIRTIEGNMNSLVQQEDESVQCQTCGRMYDYPKRPQDIVDSDLTLIAVNANKKLLRRVTRFHADYSAFWNEDDRYFDSLYHLTKSSNTQNDLIALESPSSSDR